MTSSRTTTLENRTIGAYGYGLMGLTWRATPPSTEQSFKAMKTALELGSNFWNGGEFYGPPDRNSLVLLNEYFTKHPEDQDKIVLSIKGGAGKDKPIPDGSRENVRRSVLDSLAQLQANNVTKTIDIFQCARVDPNVPIEDTITYLAELVNEGKINGIGISEVNATSIRRAAKIHRIAAVEVELSLWSPDILNNGVATTCGELNIPIIAYSPLGRGALTGEIRKNADLKDDDPRKHYPKFQDDVLDQNYKIIDEVDKIARRKGVSKAQIALAWVASFSGRTITDPKTGKTTKLPQVIPIPGATTEARIRENIRPDITLTDDEFDELNRLIEMFPTQGDRYPAAVQKLWVE